MVKPVSSEPLDDANHVNTEETPDADKKDVQTVSRFRRTLPQVLAISVVNMVVINLTMALFLSTLIIAELHHSKEELSMDDTQASWFGGLPYFCQPVGALASGFIVQVLGRRRSLFLINIPYTIGCVLISIAPNVTVLFLVNVLFGVTVGCTEAPINSYFGEICEPHLRSMLAGSAGIFYQGGMFLLFVLGSMLHWRTTAGIVAVLPIITMLLFIKVPESPIWLISKGRMKDAEASLCWLRGWVEPSAVQQEFAELVRYHESVTQKRKTAEEAGLLLQNGENGTAIQITKDTKEPQPEGRVSRFLTMAKLLLEPQTFRPLLLTVTFFLLSGMGGSASIRPFLVEVLDSFHVPIEGKQSTVIYAVAGFLGVILMVATINKVGKRKMALAGSAACAVSCLLLGLYAYLTIVPAVRTGDDSYLVATWLPLVLLSVVSFASIIQCQVPWLLVAEAFPFRTRGVAGGMSAASFYIFSFLAAKTYLSTRNSFQLYGAFWFYGAVNCICFVYLFFQLPETEGKSLQEIERLFAGNKRRSK